MHKRYGPHLVAILEHQDEANPHLHFYAIEPDGLDVKRIHEGWTAKKDGQEYRAQCVLYKTITTGMWGPTLDSCG